MSIKPDNPDLVITETLNQLLRLTTDLGAEQADAKVDKKTDKPSTVTSEATVSISETAGAEVTIPITAAQDVNDTIALDKEGSDTKVSRNRRYLQRAQALEQQLASLKREGKIDGSTYSSAMGQLSDVEGQIRQNMSGVSPV